MKHTPSPWNGHPLAFDQGLITSETGENVAICYDVKNLPLLSVAPELLEACELLMKAESMQQGERGGYVMGVISQAIDKARDAIARVKEK